MEQRNPSPEELREWAIIAQRRKAILPKSITMHGRNLLVTCGQCAHQYERKLLPNRNDPVYVCPSCRARNYVPVEW